MQFLGNAVSRPLEQLRDLHTTFDMDTLKYYLAPFQAV
jgi:hypothetical protein